MHRATTVMLAKELLERATGLDTSDPQCERTPERFVKALEELTKPVEFEFTTFNNANGYDEMITVGKIPFTSVCMHHVLPFSGHAWIAYIPENHIAGLSKISRLVEFYARNLQTQEAMTGHIAETLVEELKPKGVAVVLKAAHSCMSIRGARSIGTETITACMKGVFADHTRTAKAEFMQWVNGN